jgi:hypothetical protein
MTGNGFAPPLKDLAFFMLSRFMRDIMGCKISRKGGILPPLTAFHVAPDESVDEPELVR